MSDEEFGVLTPELFYALRKRRREHQKFEVMQTGVIASTIVNFSMGAPEKAVHPSDFFPVLKDEEANTDLTKMSPEEVAIYMRNMFSKKTYRRKSNG